MHLFVLWCAAGAGKLPLMEIVFLLERQEQMIGDKRSIAFNSVYGMPIKGTTNMQQQI